MAIQRRFGVPLSDMCTFRIGGAAAEVAEIETDADIAELFKTMPEDRKWLVIGGGSNIVFPDGDCETLLVRLAPSAIKTEEMGDDVRLIVPAGTTWDEVVSFAVDRGLSGIEALSAIPGTAGATPIQNVGAYGVETKDVLESVRAYDANEKKWVAFSNEECKFAYRDSIFKHEGKGRYIISEVTFLLSREEPNVPQYPGLADYFAERDIHRPSLQDIRDAIISIRAKKLPDPREIASVGSFFKNPFVSNEHAEKLLKEFPTIKMFPAENGMVKIPAGWLIENAGWKGKRFGTLSVYAGNALVIVNEGGATRRELAALVATITGEVQKKYGITLEPEPELL